MDRLNRWLGRLFARPASPGGPSRGATSTRAGLCDQLVCRASTETGEALLAMSPDGTVACRLVEESADARLSTFAVSPDRCWIVYTCAVQREPAGFSTELRAVSADGKNRNVLTRWDPSARPRYANPAFSPDGDRLVCEETLGNTVNPDLAVFQLLEVGGGLYASREEWIVNPLGIGNHAPRFLADSRRIVYFGNFAYEDLLEVCLYDPERAHPAPLGVCGERLTNGAHGVWFRPGAIAVQPEWEQVFFIRGHSQPSEQIGVICLADLPPGGCTGYFPTIGGDHSRIHSLRLSPDGRMLLFAADEAVFAVDTDGGNCRRISPAEAEKCRSPVFSPDGRSIAFTSGDRLWIADREGEAWRSVATEPWRVEDLAWC